MFRLNAPVRCQQHPFEGNPVSFQFFHAPSGVRTHAAISLPQTGRRELLAPRRTLCELPDASCRRGLLFSGANAALENSAVLLFTPLGCFFTPALITSGFPLGQERILSARPGSGAVRCGRSGRGRRFLQRPLQPAVPRRPERPCGAAPGAPRELPGEGSRAEVEHKQRRGGSSVEELCRAV